MNTHRAYVRTSLPTYNCPPRRVTGILGVLQDAVLRGADQLAQPEESFQTASAIQRSFQSFSFENSGDIREVLAPIPANVMGGEADLQLGSAPGSSFEQSQYPAAKDAHRRNYGCGIVPPPTL